MAEIRTLVSARKCANYEEAEEALGRVFDDIGAFELFRGKTVVLKVNLMKGVRPERALNTHPAFVRAAVRLARCSAKSVAIGDSSGLLAHTDECFEASGIGEVARQEGAKLLNFDKCSLVKKELNGKVLKSIFVARELLEAELLVTLPKLKTHTLNLMSCALKNQMGLLAGATKPAVHKIAPSVEALAHAIVDINSAIKFDLALVDAVVGLEGGGSLKGRPRFCGFVVAGLDLVAVDSVCASMVGFEPLDVPSTAVAAERGLGIADLSRIDIVGDGKDKSVAQFRPPGLDLKKNAFFSRIAYSVRAEAVKVAVNREKCQLAGTCARVCPVGAISLEPYPVIKEDCINCYCCYENCASGGIEIKTKWYLRPLVKKRMEGLA